MLSYAPKETESPNHEHPVQGLGFFIPSNWEKTSEKGGKTVKKNFAILLLGTFLSILLLLPANSTAAIIDFEGLSSSHPIPDGYAGLNWDKLYSSNLSLFNANVTSGGSSFAYLNSGVDPVPYLGVTAAGSNQTFDFTGIYMSANWARNLRVELKGYLDGSQTYSDFVTLDYRNPKAFTFAFEGIDELIFSVNPNNQPGDFIKIGSPTYSWQSYAFAMDNLDVNIVPIPGAMWLLGSGIIGLVGLRKKFKK